MEKKQLLMKGIWAYSKRMVLLRITFIINNNNSPFKQCVIGILICAVMCRETLSHVGNVSYKISKTNRCII